MSNYLIRPHHILCSLFFEGKGYSKEFIDNMTSVISALKNGEAFSFTVGVDSICAHCPENSGNECKENKKTMLYDSIVFEICEFETEREYRLEEAWQTARVKIIGCGRLGDVCADCTWFEICKRKYEMGDY